MAGGDEEGMGVLVHDHLRARSRVVNRDLNSWVWRGHRTTLVSEDVVGLVVVHGVEAPTKNNIR